MGVIHFTICLHSCSFLESELEHNQSDRGENADRRGQGAGPAVR
jgi:hypothetical protein